MCARHVEGQASVTTGGDVASAKVEATARMDVTNSASQILKAPDNTAADD